jgi:hypothetical protein
MIIIISRGNRIHTIIKLNETKNLLDDYGSSAVVALVESVKSTKSKKFEISLESYRSEDSRSLRSNTRRLLTAFFPSTVVSNNDGSPRLSFSISERLTR